MSSNNKLVCVEYAPAILKGAGAQQRHLVGCVGETLQSLITNAAKERKLSGSRSFIPVRFPLQLSNSRLAFGVERDPCDRMLLKEEGVSMDASQLVVIEKRTPTSLYKKERVTAYDKDKFTGLFESSKYLSLSSLPKFGDVIHRLQRDFPYAYTISREWYAKLSKRDQPALFVEARFYGADNVVHMYDRQHFNGVVVEVSIRPEPNAAERELGIVGIRQRRDVYLFTATRNFVSELDGTVIPRWETKKGAELIELMRKRYDKGLTLSCSDFMKMKRDQKHKKQSLQESGTKEAYAMPVEPGSAATSSQ